MSKLVNLGSLCIDHVYEVPRLARAGETVASTGYARHAGGKGLNQSLAAARAGARVAHFGCIGADGALLRQVLAAEGVDVGGIREVAEPSGHGVIQVAPDGDNAIVIAGGANRAVTPADVAAALNACAADDWLLLQNEINDLPGVLSAAAARGTRVAFNVAPVDGREQHYDLGSVALLVVNEIEAAALAGRDAPAAALEVLAQRFPAAAVVLTQGAEGLRWRAPDSAGYVPAIAVQAKDETAAGDAFTGYLMAGLLAGASLAQALRQGAAAGALAVTVAGAAPSIPARSAVQQLLAQRSE
ncbi:MAG: ribokinase [Pseudomonadales bacterium]